MTGLINLGQKKDFSAAVLAVSVAVLLFVPVF
jgi:hypothetical protein